MGIERYRDLGKPMLPHRWEGCKGTHHSPLAVVMGPGQKFLTWVGSGQTFMVWVWIWKISPKNVKSFFPSDKKKLLRVRLESTRVEAGSGSYLLWVKSKFGSDQGPSLPLGSDQLWALHSLQTKTDDLTSDQADWGSYVTLPRLLKLDWIF